MFFNFKKKKIGFVKNLWIYPVKSMQGEKTNQSYINEGGLLGDRSFAVFDHETGKIASAKNPKRWQELLQFKAGYAASPETGAPLPALTLKNAAQTRLEGDTEALSAQISQAVGRRVSLISEKPETVSVERLDPLDETQDVLDIGPFMLKGRFSDYAPVHLFSTATLSAFQELSPASEFAVQRFRPNIVIETPAGQSGFVENDWVGRQLRIGDQVRLQISDPTPRCAVPTLAQDQLVKDTQIIRTIATHNMVPVPAFEGAEMPCAGIYGFVERGGLVKEGDPIYLA